MRLTDVSLSIAKIALSAENSENITPTERAQRDLTYLQEIRSKLSDIEEFLISTDPSCSPNNIPYYPSCLYQRREQVMAVLTETLSSLTGNGDTSSAKFGKILEYLETIRQNPSLISSLFDEVIEA